MAATLFYIDNVPEVGQIAVIDGAEGHHAATVRRIVTGTKLALSDGQGQLGFGEVVAVAASQLQVRIADKKTWSAPIPHVTVVQAIPKFPRGELAVDLATEAGADTIIPWQADRCIAKWEGKKTATAHQKWQNAAVTAAKQSRRPIIPTIGGLHHKKDVAKRIQQITSNKGVALLLHENATKHISSIDLANTQKLMLVIGPEGGITPEEQECFQHAGAQLTLLGPQVLRSATAAAIALGAVGVLTQRWNCSPISTW
jgi:16S rRNA (uracil1498-N3)-methyltransferase